MEDMPCGELILRRSISSLTRCILVGTQPVTAQIQSFVVTTTHLEPANTSEGCGQRLMLYRSKLEDKAHRAWVRRPRDNADADRRPHGRG